MSAPELPPMLKPFAETSAFVRERQPQTPEFFAALDVDARMRGFTIAGLLKMSALQAAHTVAIKSIDEGISIADFNDELAALIESNGGMLLSKARLDLVFRNNNAIVASAGRYRQIVEGGIADHRPFGQYPLGPHDARTSAFCRRLEGFVFRLRSPMAKKIWPPKHHGCRHINITTLTEEQAKASGRLYEGPEDDYPFVEDPETGQPARVMPDPGWEFDPSIFAVDGKQLATEAADATRREIERKTAANYGLAQLADVAAQHVARGARLLPITLVHDTSKALREFEKAFRFRGSESSAFVADYAGDGVIVTRESFEAIYKDSPDASRYFRFLASTIENPYEAWLIPVEGEANSLSFIRRYIGLYRITAAGRLAVIVDRAPNGWLMRARAIADIDTFRREAEQERRGLLTFNKSNKKG